MPRAGGRPRPGAALALAPAAPSPRSAALPPAHRGVVRVPGFELSPPRNHCLVFGLDAHEAPDPASIPGWPRPAACLARLGRRPGVLTFLAHPDDEGNRFLGLESYRWDDWTVDGYTGLEVWNLSTDWSRHIQGYADLVRAQLGGLYRAVPPPHPATLGRWDVLAQRRPVAGIAGTDAHAHPIRWHGVPLTILPYERAFLSLATAVWVDPATTDGPLEARVGGILEALRRGRAFAVNRAWGYPSGFSFQAADTGDGSRYFSGDTVPAGRPVLFEVVSPALGWIRLIRNGAPVANTYGRALRFEPLGPAAGGAGTAGAGSVPGAVQEAWRAEIWIHSRHWTRTGSGFFLWILSNFIYRSLQVGRSRRTPGVAGKGGGRPRAIAGPAPDEPGPGDGLEEVRAWKRE